MVKKKKKKKMVTDRQPGEQRVERQIKSQLNSVFTSGQTRCLLKSWS